MLPGSTTPLQVLARGAGWVRVALPSAALSAVVVQYAATAGAPASSISVPLLAVTDTIDPTGSLVDAAASASATGSAITLPGFLQQFGAQWDYNSIALWVTWTSIVMSDVGAYFAGT